MLNVRYLSKDEFPKIEQWKKYSVCKFIVRKGKTERSKPLYEKEFQVKNGKGKVFYEHNNEFFPGDFWYSIRSFAADFKFQINNKMIKKFKNQYGHEISDYSFSVYQFLPEVPTWHKCWVGRIDTSK